MNIWSRIPFLRLLLPFLAGILTAVYSGWEIEYLPYILLLLFGIIALFVFFSQLNVSYAYSPFFGMVIFSVLFFSGFQITFLKTEKNKKSHFGRYADEAEIFIVKSSEPYLEKEKSCKIEIEILSARKNGKWISTSGRAMCYFKKDSASKKINYGDVLLVKTKFNPVKPPQEPKTSRIRQRHPRQWRMPDAPRGRWEIPFLRRESFPCGHLQNARSW